MERIWSTDWWIHPERRIEAIERALDEAKRGVPATPVVVDPLPDGLDPDGIAIARVSGPDEVDGGDAGRTNELAKTYAAGPAFETSVAQSDAKTGPVPYRHAQLRDRHYDREDIFERSSTSAAVEALAEIIRVEGPIVEELALRRVAECFGVQRVTKRFRTRFREIRVAALHGRPSRLVDDVFWPDGLDPDGFAIVRVPGSDPDDRRDLEHIPLVERVNAVVHVLNEQFGLPEADLERETARLLGWQRLTARASAAIRAAVEAAVEQGRAKSGNGRVSIPAG